MPFFLSNEPGLPMLQIAMSGSVGRGGNNSAVDVRLLQAMLNANPPMTGRPTTPLKTDGVIGPLTIGAIQRYQTRSRLISDGRMDFGGPTMRALLRDLARSRAAPKGFPNLGDADAKIVKALGDLRAFSTGGISPAPKMGFASAISPPPSGNRMGATAGGFRSDAGGGASEWNVTSSGSLSVSFPLPYLGKFGGGGLTFVDLYTQRDSQPGVPYKFTFAGAGVGLSTLPVGLSIAPASLPSFGTRLYNYPGLSMNRIYPPSDLVTSPNTLINVEANVPGLGWAGCLFLGRPLWAALTGMQFAGPSAGITLYFGGMAGFL